MPRIRSIAAALAVGALSLAPAALAEEGPTWVPSLRKAFALSKERGAPILVWCVTDGEPSNTADIATLQHKDVQKAMTGYLAVLGDDKDAHGSQDGTLNGKPAKVCRLAPGITCADHKAAINEIYTTYPDVCVDKSSNLKMPCHFVAGPDGKVVGTINNGTLAGGFDTVTPPNMVRGLKELMAKAGGPGLTDSQYADLQKALASGRTLVEAGRLKEGARALRPFAEVRKNIALVVEAREILKKVDREAAPALAKAQARLRENPLAGLAALDQVVEDYPGTESAAAARKASADFKDGPEGKRVLKDMAREKEGRVELQKALEIADSRKDDARALRALDAVAKKYEGLPCGAEAAAKADSIRVDPARMGALRKAEEERAAKSALTAARGLLDAGKKDEAAARLREIAEKWKDTEAGKEAARLLEGIR